MDQIVRKNSNGEPDIPVATVSRDYALIQHTWLLDAFLDALKLSGVPVEHLNGELWLSEYGERMRLSLRIPASSFDPGDGYPMDMFIQCYNSVDKSCALEISTRWLRIICSNGLVGESWSDFRKVHIGQRITKERVAEHISKEFDSADRTKAVYGEWLSKEITLDDVYVWADGELSRRWGKHAAARVCCICRIGQDGNIEPTGEQIVPHKARMTNLVEVPGACAPASDIYHVAQALSWIAGKRGSVEDSEVKVREIPSLLAPFLS